MDPTAESTHSNNASSSDGKLRSSITENQKDRIPYIDPAIEKRLVRKLDLRMLLWSFLAYFANLLDRNNLRTFYHFFILGTKTTYHQNVYSHYYYRKRFYYGYGGGFGSQFGCV